MDDDDILAQARDMLTVKRIFGDPIHRQGVTVTPVANVILGVGRVRGRGQCGEEGGARAGFAMRGTPAGAYVITGETVTWQPTLDLNHVILVGQIVSILIALATIRAALRSRRPRV